jgi:hypothetical protein
LKEQERAEYAWYWAGLALLECVLLKITVYEGMGFWLALYSFLYMLMFTLFYFKYVYDKMLSKNERHHKH